jgi:hypothetical protein
MGGSKAKALLKEVILIMVVCWLLVYLVIPDLFQTMIPDALKEVGASVETLYASIVSFDQGTGWMIGVICAFIGMFFFMHHEHHGKGYAYLEGALIIIALSTLAPIVGSYLHAALMAMGTHLPAAPG